jgi:hypothetical protein
LGGHIQDAKTIAGTNFSFEEGVSVFVDGMNLAAPVVKRQPR